MPNYKNTGIEEFSSSLDWREFEKLAESVFKSFGFVTIRNYRLRKPKAEIDLLATRSTTAFVVDCKHLKRTVGRAAMLEISERQIERAQRVIQLEDIRKAIPVILTLHDEFLQILENGTPIVPIQKISDFILNWEVAQDIRVISERTD